MNEVVEWLESEPGQEWSKERHGRGAGVLGYRRLPGAPDRWGSTQMGVPAFASIEWDHCCNRVAMTICEPDKGRFYMGKAYDTSVKSRALIEWGWSKTDMADIPKGLSSPA